MKPFVRIATAAALALGATLAATGAAEAKSGPWLSPGQFPLNSVFHWKSDGRIYTQQASQGDFQWLFVCGQGSPLHELGATSVTVENVRANRSVYGGQLLFHFRSTAAARSALAKVKKDYAGCAKRIDKGWFDERNGKHVVARVNRTASIPGGVAYRTTLRATDGRPAVTSDLPSDAQEFFVQRGRTLELVSVMGADKRLDNVRGAQHNLRYFANRLA